MALSENVIVTPINNDEQFIGRNYPWIVPFRPPYYYLTCFYFYSWIKGTDWIKVEVWFNRPSFGEKPLVVYNIIKCSKIP
jgi:hypothetical protein